MKAHWIAILLASLLTLPACTRRDNKPTVDEDDLQVDIDQGVETDADMIDTDRTGENKAADTTTGSSSTDSSESTTESTSETPNP